ncbi:MAG TPA: 3-hydroxyacyl-ACP dehydratase FabZ [Chthonomonadaceae bacterium]|nr:3-hydroxyacyl-ACP dehydratase FabZ [Chthonomonadaceae bacterium]
MSHEDARSGTGGEPERYVLDIEDIRAMLPHRFPMLLVDKILELEPGKRVVGLKNVTINEPHFTGHFPGQAIMPGVLILESMAQVAGLMMLALPDHEGKLAYIAAMDKVHFRKPVIPGDTLITEANILWVRGKMGKVRMVARVNGEVHAECEMTFALMERRTGDQTKQKLDTVRREANGGEGNSAGGHISARPIHHHVPGDAVAAGQGSRELRGAGGCE